MLKLQMIKISSISKNALFMMHNRLTKYT